MASRERQFLYILIAYGILEIVVDNVLVFLGLTTGQVPSLTLSILGLFGIEIGALGDVPALLTAVAWPLGAAGCLLIVIAIWHVVGH